METFTCRKKVNNGVSLNRYQNREAGSPERGILMPSDKTEIMNLLPLLTEDERSIILAQIKSLLSEQGSAVAAPVSIGQ